jgi:hypothetical protein
LQKTTGSWRIGLILLFLPFILASHWHLQEIS